MDILSSPCKRLASWSFLVLLSLGRHAAASESPSSARCDFVGSNLRSIDKEEARACARACAEEKACVAWTFISGWQRCFLKNAVQRRLALTLYAGERGGAVQKDSDYTGKDLQQLVASSTEACSAHCTAEPRCLAFVYIDGYSTCWLKHTKGRFLGKVFSCGSDAPSP